VIELENTLKGSIFPQGEIIRISEYARKRGIKLHLDGARIWHATIETSMPLDVLSEPFDSISACFSKGLGQCDLLSRTRMRRALSSPLQVLPLVPV